MQDFKIKYCTWQPVSPPGTGHGELFFTTMVLADISAAQCTIVHHTLSDYCFGGATYTFLSTFLGPSQKTRFGILLSPLEYAGVFRGPLRRPDLEYCRLLSSWWGFRGSLSFVRPQGLLNCLHESVQKLPGQMDFNQFKRPNFAMKSEAAPGADFFTTPSEFVHSPQR